MAGADRLRNKKNGCAASSRVVFVTKCPIQSKKSWLDRKMRGLQALRMKEMLNWGCVGGDQNGRQS
jgi:hypothetical protein